MNNITFELAKIAKEKGFEEKVLNHYDIEGNYYGNDRLIWTANLEQGIDIDEFYMDCNNLKECGLYEDLNIISAPTYHKLINFIFSEVSTRNYTKKGNIEWLKTWYNLLKDCPLKYEFKGRLLEWFRVNGYNLNIAHRTHSQTYNFTITGKYDKDKAVLSNHSFDKLTYEEAKHFGILEIFKLKNNK